MLENYKTAFAKLSRNLDVISKKYGKSRLSFFADAAWCHIRYGVTPNQYVGFQFYRLSSLERKQFYTARFQDKYDEVFNPKSYSHLFNDKEKTLKTFADYVHRDWLFTPDATLEQIQEFIDSHPKIICKPSNMSSGRGIFVRKDETARMLKEGSYLLEEFVTQHHSISELNPSSVNTVRVYTLISKNKNTPPTGSVPEIQYIATMIRIGGQGSEVDNYHSGGVGYPIDLETGLIGGPGYDINGEPHIVHPGTGKVVIGFRIPRWEELKKYVAGLCTVVPQCRLIAWDVVVTEDGFDLIEANCNGDSGFMQSVSKVGKRRQIMAQL